MLVKIARVMMVAALICVCHTGLAQNLTGVSEHDDDSGSQEYISVNPRISPSNNYVGGPIGVISISWPGVRLKMDSEDKDLKTPVSPSFVTLTVNGNEIPIRPDEIGGGRIWVKAQYDTDNTTEWRIDDVFIIELPDMFFFWVGKVELSVKAGAVESVDGRINSPINLNYTFMGLDYDVKWLPERDLEGKNVEFNKGECIIYAWWEGYDDISLNSSSSSRPFIQKATDEDNGVHTNASQYMSIEEGKVKFDFSTLEEGSYILDIPDNAIVLSPGVGNGEATYNFLIKPSGTSGVEGISHDEGLYRVYTLQGVKVMEAGSKAELSNLPAGLYVINGEKVLIGF